MLRLEFVCNLQSIYNCLKYLFLSFKFSFGTHEPEINSNHVCREFGISS